MRVETITVEELYKEVQDIKRRIEALEIRIMSPRRLGPTRSPYDCGGLSRIVTKAKRQLR